MPELVSSVNYPQKTVITKNILDEKMIFSRNEKGISIYLKSSTIEHFFKMNKTVKKENMQTGADTEDDKKYFNELSAYVLPTGLDSYTRRTLAYIDQTQLYVDGYLNMSFLRCVGIENGIEIIIQTVCSKAEFRNYVRQFGVKLKEFAEQYLKPQMIELSLRDNHISLELNKEKVATMWDKSSI